MANDNPTDPLADPSLRVSRADPREMKLFDQHLRANPKAAAVLGVALASLGWVIALGVGFDGATLPAKRWVAAVLAWALAAWCISGTVRALRPR